MMDVGAQSRVAAAWTDAAARCMGAAFALGVSNMSAMVDIWSGAANLGSSSEKTRPRTSTVRSWYRAPEPNPFDLTAWFPTSALPPSSPLPGAGAFAYQPIWGALPFLTGSSSSMWSPRGPSPSAAVPGLLALVALGAIAQQTLAMMEASRRWQSMTLVPEPLPTPSFALPSYRSDGGHAVAGIIHPEAVTAAVAMPIGFFALLTQMMRAAIPH